MYHHIQSDFSPLPFKDIQNIFQSGNKHIYSTPTTNDSLALISNWSAFLADISSDSFVHFKPHSPAEGMPLHLPQNMQLEIRNSPKGAGIALATYQSTAELGAPRKYFSMMVFETLEVDSNGKKITAIKPYMALNGIVDGINQFHPIDIYCAIDMDGNTVIVKGETMEDFKAMVCYAEAAFEIILAGLHKPEILQDCQCWLNEESLPITLECFDYLCKRDSAELAKSIDYFSTPAQVEFVASPSATPQ